MALSAWKASPWLLASFGDFEPAEHVPGTPLYAGPLRATESTQKDPRPEEKKCRRAKKVHLVHGITMLPFGMLFT